MWPFKSKEEKERAAEARDVFDSFVSSVSTATPGNAITLARAFATHHGVAALDSRELEERRGNAFRTYAETVLADDHLTADEEEAFGEVAGALGITQDRFQAEFGDTLSRLMVARLNNGRLEPLAAHELMAKRGETVYLEIGAALMKEVAIREWQGGSAGVSFRIMKGVRYNVGRVKGRSVVVGTERQIDDVGLLAVSSKRIVFMGEKRAIEIPLAKLLNLDMFEDGVRLHASNRQRAPLFQLQSNTADVFGATVNAVMQELV